MFEFNSRTALLIGENATAKLQQSHVLVVGVGGVGGYAAELLCRAGIGSFTIIDGDSIDITNINRQIIASHSDIGKSKVDVMKKRMLDINPQTTINAINRFLNADDVTDIFNNNSFDFVVDAIDSIPAKCQIIKEASSREIDIISSMGAGCRIDASKVRLDKLCNTHHDGLSKAVRKRFTGSDIPNRLTVVFSEEPPIQEATEPSDIPGKRATVGTISYIPAVFGCYMAQYVIKCITN